jgi:hypothetical protein
MASCECAGLVVRTALTWRHDRTILSHNQPILFGATIPDHLQQLDGIWTALQVKRGMEIKMVQSKLQQGSLSDSSRLTRAVARPRP